jgi:hypothetical protein
MRIIFKLVVVLVLVGAIWFYQGRSKGQSAAIKGNETTKGQSTNGTAGVSSGGIDQAANGTGNSSSDNDEEADDMNVPAPVPAAEKYKSAEEALEAVKKAASEYDDAVIEEFTDVGANCSWCGQFYQSLTDMLKNGEGLKSDEKSFYAELLAVSGRTDNLKTLVDLIKGAKSTEEAGVFAESLELAVGKDDAVTYLATELKANNQVLKEAVVGALTNQTSRLAIETLYNHTTENGDPDGYYTIGLGLGETIPSEDAYTFLQDQIGKRDQYSNLAVKSLLNAGLPGLRLVIDSLTNSKNPDFDRTMLKDAADHVVAEDGVKEYLESISQTAHDPVVAEWSKQLLEQVVADQAEMAASDDGSEAETEQ